MNNIFSMTTLLFTLMFSATTSFAQTKAETEQWILEKLYKYRNQSDDNACAYHVYEIKNGYIHYYCADVTRGHHGRYDVSHIKFPIWAITEVKYRGNVLRRESLIIEMPLDRYCEDCIKEYYTGRSNSTSRSNLAKEVNVDVKGYGKHRLDKGYFTLYYESTVLEENFAERFTKAIEHLKTFYPKPEKRKETF